MRILVIEESDADFALIERGLGSPFIVTRALTLQQGLEAANASQFDLLILDLSLKDSSGYETFEKARAQAPHLPILILSGIEDDALALRAVSSGAQDYLRKSRLRDCPLERIVRYAIERSRVEERARNAEHQYRALLDHLPTAAFMCDAQGLITYFNAKAVEIWGRTPKLNDPVDRYSGSWRLFSTDGNRLTHDQSWVARTLRELKCFNGREIIIEQPGGERRRAMVQTTPVLDKAGALAGCIAVLVDITGQRRAERALRESERFARSTVNSLLSHIAILDEVGTILAVNTAWRRFADESGSCIAGYAIGTNYLQSCDQAACNGDETARRAAAGIRDVLQHERQSFELEYPCHTPHEERWIAMRVTPFEGDGPTRVVLSHENITSRKIAERLASEQVGLRQAVAGMEQVLGVVGHELRTPLAALRAISEFLITDGARNTAEADRFVHVISEEVDRMSDTVNNLLEAARLNSGRAKWNWSAVDIAGTIEDALDSIRPLVDPAHVQLRIETEGTIQSMPGDADGIRRLLINLLNNARKHTDRGRITVVARRYIQGGHPWVELAVRDTGSGIPTKMVARLGEAFALNSGVVGRNHISGTGLGLAICKGIVKAHGGELTISSVEGRGTTVTARLRADLQVAANGDTEIVSTKEAVTA